MAKLGAYYSLCPIIDHRSLLGISPDRENGKVLVGLGKNIAVKYRLSDQKQLESWRTKEKFTSPIIYDKIHNVYTAVFNQSYIRMWCGENEVIDKLKKYKFNKQIQSLIECNDQCFVVFQNGVIQPLHQALEKRKEPACEDIINTKSDYIKDVLYTTHNGDTYIGLIVSPLQGNPKNRFYWTKFNPSGDHTPCCQSKLERKGFQLTGHLLYVIDHRINLLSLWSDGRIYSFPLNDSNENKPPGDLYTVIESISCDHAVSMTSLDENYIALYGGDCNDEGALLIIYNVQFKVTQSKLSFKMFTIGAKLWTIDNNLYLPVGQNLAVIPFRLDAEQLAALVGSHKTTEIDSDISIVHQVLSADWDGATSAVKNSNRLEQPLKSQVREYLTQGLPESSIIEQLLPDLIASKNITCIAQCVEYFSDIPEVFLAKLLKFCLNLNRKSFKQYSNSSVKDFPDAMQPLEKSKLIDSLLIKPFSEILILNHLRAELDLNDVLILLDYLCFLLCDQAHSLQPLNCVETEGKIINWGCVLLDANYQKILLSEDEQIKDCIVKFHNLIKLEAESLEDLQDIAPMLIELWRGPSYQIVNEGGVGYSIEELSLY